MEKAAEVMAIGGVGGYSALCQPARSEQLDMARRLLPGQADAFGHAVDREAPWKVAVGGEQSAILELLVKEAN